MPRRKPGTLLPIEVDILGAGLERRREGDEEFYGFELARSIAGGRAGRKLTSHGTLYKALGRLEDAGLLTSRWEDASLATAEGRPPRRLYTVTGEGARRLAAWQQEHAAAHLPGQPRWEGGT
jgi:PadR family transcriptional regulator, regulatory protein PadR